MVRSGQPQPARDRRSRVNGQYRPVAGDFDGDGATEILWYAPGRTADPLWNWNGSGWSATSLHDQRHLLALRRRLRRRRRRRHLLVRARAPRATASGTARPAAGSPPSPPRSTGVYSPFVGNLDGQHGDDMFWYAPGAAADYLWYANAHRGNVSSASYRDQRSATPRSPATSTATAPTTCSGTRRGPAPTPSGTPRAPAASSTASAAR